VSFGLGGIFLVTPSSGNIVVRDELILGQRELTARFRASTSYTVGARELLPFTRSSNAIYHLVAGWACRFRDFPNGHQAIVDVYLPGDVIGLERMLFPRTLTEVMTLTSVATEVIDTEAGLADLMSRRSTALYVAWLLARQQRHSDRFFAAVSSLDARGRLATMVLDFYKRLRLPRSITGSTYNLPLTQTQIGAYLGLTVAHVNRVLRFFRDEKIVHLEKHCVTILDLECLARLAQSTTARSPTDHEKRLVNEPIPLKGQSTRINVIPDPGEWTGATAAAHSLAQAANGDVTACRRSEVDVLAISLPR
jgi:CRP/FNR family transcriptional regulator